MKHVFVLFPGEEIAVCQNCGQKEPEASKICTGTDEGVLPESPPELIDPES